MEVCCAKLARLGVVFLRDLILCVGCLVLEERVVGMAEAE